MCRKFTFCKQNCAILEIINRISRKIWSTDAHLETRRSSDEKWTAGSRMSDSIRRNGRSLIAVMKSPNAVTATAGVGRPLKIAEKGQRGGSDEPLPKFDLGARDKERAGDGIAL